MTASRLAIFIPCYNAAATIGLTLSSIQQAISKTLLEIPVFIYDDCSTDDSINVSKSSWHSEGRFTIVKNKQNSGERSTTNKAFNDFREYFDWVFMIHADDIVKEDWLIELISLINSLDSAEYFTIWSSYDTFNDTTGTKLAGDNSLIIHNEQRSQETIKYFLSKVYCDWHISGAVINVNLFHRLNGFDEQMAQFGDTDFFVRGLLAGFRDIYLSRTLTFYRVSQASVSAESLRTNRDIREISYLANKFRSILSKKEISSMYGIIRRLSTRRMIKGLVHRNLTAAFLNFQQLGKSLLK